MFVPRPLTHDQDSWRCCDCQRVDWHEHRCGVLPSSYWHRCLCHLWGFARDIHLRLESYHYLVHYYLYIYIPSIVSTQFYVEALVDRGEHD